MEFNFQLWQLTPLKQTCIGVYSKVHANTGFASKVSTLSSQMLMQPKDKISSDQKKDLVYLKYTPIQVCFKGVNTHKSMLMHPKDKISSDQKKDLVYSKVHANTGLLQRCQHSQVNANAAKGQNL